MAVWSLKGFTGTQDGLCTQFESIVQLITLILPLPPCPLAAERLMSRHMEVLRLKKKVLVFWKYSCWRWGFSQDSNLLRSFTASVLCLVFISHGKIHRSINSKVQCVFSWMAGIHLCNLSMKNGKTLNSWITRDFDAGLFQRNSLQHYINFCFLTNKRRT